MIFGCRSLQPDTRITSIVAVKDYEGRFDSIAVAQGSTMHIINIDNYEITESYPFQSPIEFLESCNCENRPIFILLRNLHWFIFEGNHLENHGSLFNNYSNRCVHSINQGSPFNNEQLGGPTINATAILRYKESRILHTSHPHFVALHIYHNMIHVIPIDDENRKEPYVIQIVDVNVVDIAFFGPFSVSSRLAVLSDVIPTIPSDASSIERRLTVYSLKNGQDNFTLDFSLKMPVNAYFLLPLHPRLHSTIDVFTYNGLIRVTALEGVGTNIEHLSAYMPPIVVEACHFYDDIYLLCDSCGGLTGASLTVDGPLSTENMMMVGPCNSILAIDKNRFVISSPFGDATFYNFSLINNRFQISKLHSIESYGPISCLRIRDEGLLCSTGRGSNTSIRLFESALTCYPMAEIPVERCLSIFAANYSSQNSLPFFLCMCFFNQTCIMKYDGKNLNLLDWKDIEEISNSQTILFAKNENNNEIIHVSNTRVASINIETGETSSTYGVNGQIVAASLTKHYIVIAIDDDSNIICVLNNKSLSKVKRWKLNKKILLISSTDENISVYLADNTLFLFFLADSKRSQQIPLPHFTTPVSLLTISPDLVIVGTASGNVIRILNSFTRILSENVGESKIILHSIPKSKDHQEGNIVCSGAPPFILKENERKFIQVGDCEDIAIIDNFLCCLQKHVIRIYSFNEHLSAGKMKIKQTIPNILSFVFDANNYVIAHCSNHSILQFQRGIESASYQLPQTDKIISFFKYMDLNGECCTIIGDDFPSITILDSNLQRISWQKMLSTPFNAIMYKSYLVIAREGSLDFFKVKILDGEIEMDRKFIAPAKMLTSDLIVYNSFLITSDINQAITVYSIVHNNLEIISQDNSPKHITNMAMFKDIIFASSLDSMIYMFTVTDNGKLTEIGSYLCDSKVLSFAVNNDYLYFGTEGGGVGVFEQLDDTDYLKLSNELQNLNLETADKKCFPQNFTWNCDNPFINLENLKVLSRIPRRDLQKILKKAQISQEKFDQMNIL